MSAPPSPSPPGIATPSRRGLMSAADKLKLDGIAAGATSTIPPADWTLGATRWYAVDFTAGNDANVGYSDISMASAGAVARKTWAGIAAIIPRSGADRNIVIAIKARDASGTSYGEDLLCNSFLGYRNLHVVGTTDFSDTVTDRILSGFITSAAGPGGGGVWTCAGGATVNAISISTGSLPASPAAVGKRIRFTGNVTSALANVARQIYSNTTGSLVLLRDLVTPPAAGDTFTIEHPGVVFDSVQIANTHSRLTVSVRGLAATVSGFSVIDGFSLTRTAIVGCECRAGTFTLVDCDDIGPTATYLGIDTVNSFVGTGVRASAGWTATNIRNLSPTDTVIIGTTTWRQVRETIQNGMLCLGPVNVQGCGVGSQSALVGFVWGRNNGGWRDMTIDGGPLTVASTVGFFQNMIIQNAGAVDAIQILGSAGQSSFVNISGSTGNTGFGVSSSLLQNTVLQFTNVTVTGTAGDLKMGNSVRASWTDLVTTNIPDLAGNDHQAAVQLVARGAVIQVTNASGVTLVPGELVRFNGSAQVTSAQADTLGNASGPLGVVLNTALNTATLIVAPLGTRCNMSLDGAFVAGGLVYISPTIARRGTMTPPVSGVRRRLGLVASGASATAIVIGTVENLAVTADGGA